MPKKGLRVFSRAFKLAARGYCEKLWPSTGAYAANTVAAIGPSGRRSKTEPPCTGSLQRFVALH
jgi:hypothetical protein